MCAIGLQGEIWLYHYPEAWGTGFCTTSNTFGKTHIDTRE